MKQWGKTCSKREYNWVSWICTSFLIIICGVMEFRNKQNTQQFEFPELHPKVTLAAIIPKVKSIILNVCTWNLTSTSPLSNVLRPASFVHFLWVRKGTNASSKELIVSHFLWQMLLHWLFQVKEYVEQKLHCCLTAMVMYVILSNVDKKPLKWERNQ